MNLIKPKKLKKGDRIRIIAPSGNIEKEKVINSKQYFESQGYVVTLGKNLFKKDRYMAGSDKERLEDLHDAFKDTQVDAIICARGGYGAIRLIKDIDYKLIRNNPKIFCGYSDISALSAMILKNSGLITFSGPMLKSDFQPHNLNEYTISSFWETLANDNIQIKPEISNSYYPNDAQGILFGGNLATIASLCGIDFVPEQDFLFFAEDLYEPVYKIDKYFTQLLNIEQFKKNIKAIILGEFIESNNETQLQELFKEIAEKHKIPVIGTYPISHSEKKATIPYGGMATLENGILTIKY